MGQSSLTSEEFEDRRGIGHFLLDDDRKKNNRDERGGDSLHQILDIFCVSWTVHLQCCHGRTVFETMVCTHCWKARKQLCLTKEGITFECRSDDYVPVVAVNRTSVSQLQ